MKNTWSSFRAKLGAKFSAENLNENQFWTRTQAADVNENNNNSNSNSNNSNNKNNSNNENNNNNNRNNNSNDCNSSNNNNLHKRQWWWFETTAAEMNRVFVIQFQSFIEKQSAAGTDRDKAALHSIPGSLTDNKYNPVSPKLQMLSSNKFFTELLSQVIITNSFSPFLSHLNCSCTSF